LKDLLFIVFCDAALIGVCVEVSFVAEYACGVCDVMWKKASVDVFHLVRHTVFTGY
jgi:hypothetical protein